MKQKLNIITSVSRPQNLSILKENIEKEVLPYFDVAWYCIYDVGKNNTIIEFSEPWIISAEGGIENDCAGGSQRNVALDMIKDGWVYFLDDDNVFYERFGKIMHNHILNNPSIGGFVFNQDNYVHDLYAKPENVRVGKIDMAQVLINIETIGHYRFFENLYQSDYFFIKYIYKKNKSKFLFINEFLSYYNYLRKSILQFVHYLNDKNAGDMQSCPIQHFSTVAQTKRFHIYNLDNLHKGFPVIIGGGGLLQQGESVESIKKIIANHKSKIILWGVGVNTNFMGHTDSISEEIKNASLVGIRDVGFDSFEHIPCVSCLHPSFDKKYKIKNTIVCFEGNRLNLPIPSMCCLDGRPMEQIIEFLGSAKTIITSSYHGMYWGVLLKKEVIVIPNADSSKFFYFPYSVPKADINNWHTFIGKGKIYKEALNECRTANINFANKVGACLNLKFDIKHDYDK